MGWLEGAFTAFQPPDLTGAIRYYGRVHPGWKTRRRYFFEPALISGEWHGFSVSGGNHAGLCHTGGVAI